MSRYRKVNLTVVQSNICGLRGNKDELEQLLVRNDVDVCLLQETKIRQAEHQAECGIRGYALIKVYWKKSLRVPFVSGEVNNTLYRFCSQIDFV